MATVIMASTAKPLVAPSPPPKKNPFRQLPPLLKKSLPAFKSISLAGAAATFLLPHPALAVEMEKAALFDFNLTLPIIMAEFLLLMVALDKIYYSPLGKFMDDRDADIREKLNSVKDTSAEVKQLEEQGNAIMRAAKAEMAAATAKIVKEKEAELAIKLAEESAKLEKELQEALAGLEAQKEETIKALDAQIAILSEDIISKVIPV